MRKFGFGLALAGAAACLGVVGMQFAGRSGSVGGIAVVDLDKVAAETGKSVEMRQALQAQENAFKQELVTFRDKANAELETRAKDLKELGESAPQETKREFLQLRQNASTILAQAQNAAGTKLNQMHQVQIARFRAELKPIIQEAAAKRGLSVVIPKNEGLLLSVEPGVDITSEVIKAYQARPAQKAPAAVAAPAATAQAPAQAEAKAPARAAAKEAKEAKDSDAPVRK